MKIGKYSFDSKKQAVDKIKALGVSIDEDGNEYPSHKHTVVKLGYIVLKEGEYSQDGEVVSDPVLSKKFHVDVLWADNEGHPYGWAGKAEDIEGDGVHSFLGLNYNSFKI